MNKKHVRIATLIIFLLSSLILSCGVWENPESNYPTENRVSTPQFSYAGGIYNSDISVEIGCTTPDAQIYYTKNGEAPTIFSSLYNTPVLISGNGTEITIKAIAVKDGMENSNIAEATYEIDISDIDVTSPNTSATWWWNKENVEVTWEHGDLDGNVRLDLYKGETLVDTIISSTTNDGSYTGYNVPSGLNVGADYRVRVYYDSEHYAFSEYFTITSYLIKITLQSGIINGYMISPSDPEITVDACSQITGNLIVRVINNMPAAAIAPLAATPTWGNPESSYWAINSDVSTGENDYTVPIDVTVPCESGTYYIVVAMAGTYNADQLMSGTHPGCTADWTNGNIVALLDESNFETAIEQGYINFSWYDPDGPIAGTMAMTAVRIIVEEAVDGTYSFRCVDSEKEIAYKEINYGDFTLEVDFKMEECTWSGGIAFGLWNPDIGNSSRATFGVSNDDGGRVFILSIDGGGSQKAYYNYSLDTWYTALMSYDWSEQSCTLVIKNRSSGTTVATASITDAPIPAGVSGLLIGNPGGDGYGTASCEIDNLSMTENGQVVYQEDFSQDPAWTVTDPSDLYRINSSETYHLTCVESEGEYVYEDINYGSFTLEADIKIDACTWSGGVLLGLWNPDITDSGRSILIFSNADGGRNIMLSTTDGAETQYFDYTYTNWYRCILSYNYQERTTSLVIQDRSTSTIVATFSMEDISAPYKITQLILGDPGGDGSGMSSGEIDNIIITENGQVVYDEDFSQDPGWTATDVTDLFWMIAE
ncbi:MAG: hypothetical protein CVV44_17225 [Spirochaetae bacterium HGW-Spirochaetae-1]|jgi:hypothetical protein|nr:MAG: hypothetical protein CVV44_17225 [Spirochaetae bacterium HGW-Spirochaetae-1]